MVCAGCGLTVLQKAMIPVVASEGSGHTYLCQACARGFALPALAPKDEGEASDTTEH